MPGCGRNEKAQIYNKIYRKGSYLQLNYVTRVTNELQIETFQTKI